MSKIGLNKFSNKIDKPCQCGVGERAASTSVTLRVLPSLSQARKHTKQQAKVEPTVAFHDAQGTNAAIHDKESLSLRTKLRHMRRHDPHMPNQLQLWQANTELVPCKKKMSKHPRKMCNVRVDRPLYFSLMPDEVTMSSPLPPTSPELVTVTRPRSASRLCSTKLNYVGDEFDDKIERLIRRGLRRCRKPSIPVENGEDAANSETCKTVDAGPKPEPRTAVPPVASKKEKPEEGLDPSNYFGQSARDTFFELFRELCRQESAYTPPAPLDTSDAAAKWRWICQQSHQMTDAKTTNDSTGRLNWSKSRDYCTAMTDATGNCSPRTQFARGLVQNLQKFRELADSVMKGDEVFCLPEPVFVRPLSTMSLELSHRAYGDAAAMLLATVINYLPNLQRLSIRDNRLTDRGTSAIVGAVCGTFGPTSRLSTGTRGLVALDLSQNILDSNAVLSLADFLRRPDCRLANLHLDSADIDDNEISLLVLALEDNKSLKELSISSNFLGGVAEKLFGCNVSRQDRGSSTLERVLKLNNTLEKLDLSWNHLGSISGEAIARALHVNRTLSWISLSYNCIGDQGAQAIGYSLNWNKALRFLDLSHNGIRSRGGQVIAEGLRENLRLAYVDLSGNPVGKLGGRALINILNYSLRLRKIVLRGCEFTGDDTEPGRYNPASPAGTYKLDLSRPYDWMVAQSLLWLTITRAGCQFVKLAEHRGDASREVKLIHPRRKKGTATSSTPSTTQLEPINGLVSTNECKFRKSIKSALLVESYDSLIADCDRDNSGSLKPVDFLSFMLKHLKETDTEIVEDEAQILFERIDQDNSGTVDAAKLRAFVLQGESDMHSSRQDNICRGTTSASRPAKPRMSGNTPQTGFREQDPEKRAFEAARRLQAFFRGYLARIDISQTNMMFDGGLDSSFETNAIVDGEHSNPAFECATTAIKKNRRMLKVAAGPNQRHSPSPTQCLTKVLPSASTTQSCKARFVAFSRFVVASSRQMRAFLRANGPIDPITNKPWRLPEPPAIITATFEEIPLPPIELGIHNATGISGLVELMLDDSADRVALLRLACTDLRLFSVQFTSPGIPSHRLEYPQLSPVIFAVYLQVQQFVDSIQGSTIPFNGNELVDVFVMLLPRIVDARGQRLKRCVILPDICLFCTQVTSVASLLRRNLSESELQQLSFRLGSAMPIFAGAFVAHHVLDLQQSSHRAALRRLVQMDTVYAAQQRAASSDDVGRISQDEQSAVYRSGDLSTVCRGGTSQYGDFSGFRNAHLNGSPVSARILEEFAASFGDAGLDTHPDLLKGQAMLHLDYAGILRVPTNVAVVSEFKLGLFLHKSGLRYSARDVLRNPLLAKLLPDVLFDDWATTQRLKRADMILAARKAAKPTTSNSTARTRAATFTATRQQAHENSAAARTLLRNSAYVERDPEQAVSGLHANPFEAVRYLETDPLSIPTDRDLLGSARASELEDPLSYFNWLEARGVPWKLWGECTRNQSYEEFSSCESLVKCEMESGNPKNDQRIAIVRTVQVIRVRISSPLFDKVLTWRHVGPHKSRESAIRNGTTGQVASVKNTDDPVVSTTLENSADPSGDFLVKRNEILDTFRLRSAKCIQRRIRAVWTRTAARIVASGDTKVCTFVTARIRVHSDGHVLISPGRAAARAVVCHLRSHFGTTGIVEQLDENNLRIQFRARHEVNHSPVEPRTLLGVRTRAMVHYYEAYVPGLPDPLPRITECTWAYRWTPSDEAEDMPIQTESLPKIVIKFRLLTSSSFFTSAQVRKVVGSFLELGREQGLDAVEHHERDLTNAESRYAVPHLNASVNSNDVGPRLMLSRDSHGSIHSLENEVSRPRLYSKPDVESPLESGARGQKSTNELTPDKTVHCRTPISTLDKHMLDLIVHLFGRTVDVENFFCTCVAPMPLHLRNALIARIGWLNVLNVQHAETRYELDLRFPDHWKLAHVLTQLAANEEGINFRQTSFCRTHLDAPIPGWNLPASWDVVSYTGNLAKGVPRCGLLKVTYEAEPMDTSELRTRLGRQFTLAGVPRPSSDPIDSACRMFTNVTGTA